MLSVNIVTFRKNLAEYLKLAEYRGESIKVVDDKRKKVVAELNPPKKEESWEEYMAFVDSMFGAWKDLPEDKNRKALKRAGVRKLRKLKRV